jgi:uncharacterized SAM-binding protein YcdF (DUF218 family)
VGQRRRFPLKLILAILALAAVAYLTRALWLGGLGWALVYDQGPAKADIAVVLGGDYWGHRILKAGELVRQGYVPAALVSGPPGFYGYRESELAIQYAVHHGYPAEYFIAMPVEALSTRDEASEVLVELRRRNVHSFLLVTSNFHSARATRVFRSLERGQADAPSFRTVASEHQFFRPDSWWRSREGCKVFFNEWVKTVANFLGV